MNRVEKLSWGLLAVVAVCGLAALLIVGHQQFVSCPANDKVEENYKEAIATLADIVKWGIGIAVGAASLFGSQLLAIKAAPNYSQAGRLMLVSIVVCMCLSAYFGLRWRSLVAQVWFLKCPGLIATDYLQVSFEFHTYFLTGGLGVLAVMAFLLAFPSPSR